MAEAAYTDKRIGDGNRPVEVEVHSTNNSWGRSWNLLKIAVGDSVIDITIFFSTSSRRGWRRSPRSPRPTSQIDRPLSSSG